MLEIRLFGTFDIQHDGQPVVLSSRAAQSLFAYLILSPGVQHRREKLAGMFWPDVGESKARTYLRHELWRIRKALSSHTNAEYLKTDEIAISFNSSIDVWLDVYVMTSVGDRPTVEELTKALSVYRGEFLPGFYEQWVLGEREHLQSLFDHRTGQLLELLQEGKRWHDVIEWAERWLSLSQEPESAYRYLIIAYAAEGDHARAASTYERCRQSLQSLGLEPSEETQALAIKRTPKLNIPIPVSSFIGRETELQEIRNLLTKFRLVTLTGSGGVGKTRLAIQVVGDVLDQYPDGVWLFDLAPLKDSEFLPNRLANLLGLLETGDPKLFAADLLLLYFRTRHVLLIFDNCEHLIASCADLANLLLTSCEHLSLLATSREPLRISGEVTYRVPSLDIPLKPDESTLEALANASSIRLFVERASSLSPGFVVNSQNSLALARICQRLDGIPLAIELAAARTDVLTVDQISRRLDDSFHLLRYGLRSATPRHETLQATIEWSYQLHSEAECVLFRRLACFIGGWTLEGAEEICSGMDIASSENLDLLSQLVNKSLVIVKTPASEIRYHMLETIRQYAREKLIESTEASRMQNRHMEYYLRRVEEIQPHLMSREQSGWMDYLDTELDNIRLALEWTISQKMGEESLRFFSALGWFWFIRCRFREGEEWFKRAYALKESASERIQASSLRSGSWMFYAKDDISTALQMHQESLSLYRMLGDEREVSTTLQFMGVLEYHLGNTDKARPLFEESLDLSRRTNNRLAMPRVLMHLGHYSEKEGDLAAAQKYYEESLAVCRDVGEGHLMMMVLTTMGNFMSQQKNLPLACVYFQEALQIGVQLKNKRTIAQAMLNFAEVLNKEKRYLDSATLQGLAEYLFKEGEALTESNVAEIRKLAVISRKHLGEDVYRRAFETGKLLRLEQAIKITTSKQA